MSRPSRRIGRVFLTLALAAAVPAFGDLWYKHYTQAEEALAAGDWEEAVAELDQAIERRPDPGAKVRIYGMNIIAYFPYLKRGIAYYQLGRLDAAMAEFETEEGRGEITKSDDYQQLEQYRGLARAAQEAIAAEEAQRVGKIFAESLEEARALAKRGLLDEALKALGNAQAIAPEDPQVLAVLADLRQRVARRQDERRREEQAGRWLAEGRAALDAGRPGEAASHLRRALELKPGGEAEALLATAQEQLREELRRERDATERAALIDRRLAEAAALETSGDLGAAIERLQSVLAVDPENPQALAIQRRVLEAQARDERESAEAELRESVAELIAAAEGHLGAERPEDALATANRALAFDPGNAAAQDLVRRAYQRIGRALLGATARHNLPPAITFANVREELADGSRRERVTDPDYRLSGLVLDRSPVELVFYDGRGSEIPSDRLSVSRQPLGEFTRTEFHLEVRLAAGTTVFRAVATDEEGLAAPGEFAVSYRPPFYRSLWFYGLSAATVLGLAGAVSWRRAARRRRLLRRRFNPYVAGAPVLDENLFFGREALIDRILQTVHNNSLLLYGERRIGKTTLQHQLKRRLEALDDPDYDFYPVYCDLQGTPQERFFATLADDVFHQLAPVLDGLEPAKSPDSSDYGYRDLVRDLRSALEVLRQRSSKRVKLVLLIDEVDELNDYDPRINQRLRSLFMKSFADSLVAVVSGVEIKRQWEREGSPWYNFFEEIEVQAFRPEAAAELIERPIRGVFRLEDGLIDRVIEVTGGRPYLIQKLLIALVNLMHEENRRKITVADVDAVGRPEERPG